MDRQQTCHLIPIEVMFRFQEEILKQFSIFGPRHIFLYDLRFLTSSRNKIETLGFIAKPGFFLGVDQYKAWLFLLLIYGGKIGGMEKVKDVIHQIHSRNPLAMFAPQPVGVSFETQQKGEKIIIMLRAHIVTLIPVIAEIVFLFLTPFFIALLGAFGVEIFSSLATRQLFWIHVVWYIFVFGFAFYKFIFWYYNVYLLTNERVVDFDFKGILHKETAYANLNQVQDVTPKVIGFFGTFFNFGNVYIQTAAAKPEFEFHAVEKPDLLAREVLEQVRLEETEKPGEIK